MSVTPPAETRLSDAVMAEVDRVRDSGALGAGGRLRELFDFLVQRSIEGRPPKEAEIAVAVFGKADADASRDDPVARVYIHRLRKRLQDFYRDDTGAPAFRLTVPKGEYRIVGVAVDHAAVSAASEPKAANDAASAPRRKRPLIWAAAAGLLALVAGNVAAWAMFADRHPDPNVAVRDSAVWEEFAHSERPLLIVVGDYYIFGEYQDRLFLKRLIRDFSINSKAELVDRYMTDPQKLDQYSDVALQYLPTSAAYALADIAPLFETGRPVQVALASELTPDKLKNNDIIYIGLLSAMGALRDPVFANSRFSIGESYDEIIDRKSGQHFASEAFLAAPSDTMYRDYGLFTTFSGPAGNRIAVIAGARDTALMGVAESLSQLASLKALDKTVQGKDDFEALFEVKGQKHVNLESRVVMSSGVDSAAIWSGERNQALVFPAE